MWEAVRTVQVHSSSEMQELGHRIAGIARGSDVLILTGELGAGKTTLAQGIARGLGITEPVTSPTFVLSKHYRNPRADRLDLLHLDVYRISSADELLDLWSESDARRALTLVEWGAPWAGEFGGRSGHGEHESAVAEVVLYIRSDDTRDVDLHDVSGNFAKRIAEVL